MRVTRSPSCRLYREDESFDSFETNGSNDLMMFDKLLSVENKYDELMTKLGTSEVQSDAAEYRRAAKTLSELEPLVQKFREFKGVEQDIAGAQELAAGADAEMRDLAHEELKSLEVRRDALLHELKILLIP